MSETCLGEKGKYCPLSLDVNTCSPGNSVLHKDREMAGTHTKEIRTKLLLAYLNATCNNDNFAKLEIGIIQNFPGQTVAFF